MQFQTAGVLIEKEEGKNLIRGGKDRKEEKKGGEELNRLAPSCLQTSLWVGLKMVEKRTEVRERKGGVHT